MMRFLQTEIGAEPVIAEAVFPVSPSRVFEAWTAPDQIMKWFGPKPGTLASAETDPRVGGRWRFVVADGTDGKSYLEGEYLAVETDKRLQFTWRHVKEPSADEREETPYSTVTVTFEPQGAATRVHLRHEGIVREDGRKGVGTGWEATFGHLHDLLSS